MTVTEWTVAQKVRDGKRRWKVVLHPATSCTDAFRIMRELDDKSEFVGMNQLRADGEMLTPLNVAAYAEYTQAVA